MSYFLSEKTIEQDFNLLKGQTYPQYSVLFHFLLLKAAGLNTLDPINLEDPKVKDKVFDATKKLASLFTNDDVINDPKKKFNFVNPLELYNWEKGTISEPLVKWAKNRFKNNVLGGGEQWKQLLSSDEDNTSAVTEKQQGIKKLIKTKMPADLLAIWFFRFTKFESKVSTSRLTSSFYKYFNLNKDERELLFSNVTTINPEYSDSMIDPSVIRQWLNNPKGDTDWVEDNKDIDIDSNHELITGDRFSDDVDLGLGSNKSENFYASLLNEAKQVIFMGAPGTSKSYMATQLEKDFDHVDRVQFHPQYTYQEFIGGQVLKNNNLVDKKGEFLQFLEKAMENKDQSYLFIIEEINRANVSQVFGELIQLLDRGERIDLTFNNDTETYYLPDNLKIIGTMNTTDRTVGRIDFALKRRFYQIHFYPDYALLTDKVSIEGNDISISDVLNKINANLVSVLNNKEMVIGHAMFFNNIAFHNGEYIWTQDNFCNLFNYLIEPIVEDYCDNNDEMISAVLGTKLKNQISGNDFFDALKEFVLK